MQHSNPTQAELRFELLAEIAVGATARVELCRVAAGRPTGELVAVKRLHSHIAEDPAFVNMFRDEVWMTAALKHPNVVEVVGWGQDELGPWLAVELVSGVSLARLMKTVFETGEMFSERMVVYLGRCICDGLAEAHGLCSAAGERLELVHRDLTPGNVLLGFGGQVKITDFGLAKAKQRLTRTLTGLLKGQPQYMSPEQVRGEPLDGRSDLFAFGVLLFELFSGRRPWSVQGDLDAMRAITDEPAAPLGELRPKIDRALSDLVDRCLQKDPAARYQSAVALRERLDEWLAVHGYREGNQQSLARFVRRNAMRQMRWFERAVAGEFAEQTRADRPAPLRAPTDAAGLAPADARIVQGSDPEIVAKAIDWGEDGPTLIQKSNEAREQIRRAVQRADVQPRAPLGTEPPTNRRFSPASSGPPPAHPGASGPPSAHSGVPPSAAPRPDPRSGPISARVGLPPALGPPSDLPSVPIDDSPSEDSQLATVPGNKRPPEPAAGADDADATVQLSEACDRVRKMTTAAPGLPGVVAPHDPDVPPLPAELAGPATVPLATPLPPARSEESTRQLSAPFGELPIPAMPVAEPPTDIESEARRLAASAQALTDAAKRTAGLAEAATRAAALALQAAVAAAGGAAQPALALLRQAQFIDEAVQRGDVPAATLPLGTEGAYRSGLGGTASRKLQAVRRHLQAKEMVTVAVVATVGLLAVAVLAILLL